MVAAGGVRVDDLAASQAEGMQPLRLQGCTRHFHQPAATVREGRLELLADVETANNVEVTLRIDLLEVIQQPSPATDQHQQAPPTRMVSLVTLQVLGQTVDPGGQNGDLDLGGAGIGLGPPVLPD
jgi:hypothetical protein